MVTENEGVKLCDGDKDVYGCSHYRTVFVSLVVGGGGDGQMNLKKRGEPATYHLRLETITYIVRTMCYNGCIATKQ